MTAEFKASSYDVVYSRDTILHVKNKAALFKRCAPLPRAQGLGAVLDWPYGSRGVHGAAPRLCLWRGPYIP